MSYNFPDAKAARKCVLHEKNEGELFHAKFNYKQFCIVYFFPNFNLSGDMIEKLISKPHSSPLCGAGPSKVGGGVSCENYFGMYQDQL